MGRTIYQSESGVLYIYYMQMRIDDFTEFTFFGHLLADREKVRNMVFTVPPEVFIIS
jgi:hypothetical protein